MGSALDLGTDSALSLSWLHGTAQRARGRNARRSRECIARSGRRGERPHHPLLGDLVELTPSGAFGDASLETCDAALDARAAHDDAARIHAVLRGDTAGALARRGAEP